MASTCTILLFVYLLCYVFGSAQNQNNFTTSNFIRDPETLISNNGSFQLGFFSPVNSSSRYLGIWYHLKDNNGTLEVVWVANSGNPLNDTTGLLKISEHGDLQLVNAKKKIFWSSNRSSSSGNGLVAQLEDTGNLVLLGNDSSGKIIWQSFDHPTNTLLPYMKICINGNNHLRSWSSYSNPSSGKFTINISTQNQLTEGFIWNEGNPYWRTGPWNGNMFIGIPIMNTALLLNGFNLDGNGQEKVSLAFSSMNQSTLKHFELNTNGIFNEKQWDNGNKTWEVIWSSFKSNCDIYGYCGQFGSCNAKGSPICKCLKGFQPNNMEEWRKGNWTSGCFRRTPLQCGSNGIRGPDWFLKLTHMKTPADAILLSAKDENDCRRQCSGNCVCLAYAYYDGVGCMIWNKSLIDIQDFSVYGVDLFIRLADAELGEPSKLKIIIPVLAAAATISFAVMCFLWRRTRPRNAKKAVSKFKSNVLYPNISEAELQDLPLFTFEKLVSATDNFHETNKLGRGGFGPVYKGKLKDRQEIAVKRLARRSGQGLREFMNEVVLISKLQHMNLVRLLGCCVERDEKMLVYEYMPNNSLNAVLFDPVKKKNLNWKTRYNIIEGICRGLLYLHRDSRLKIIHRDLKAGNILLDKDLNPKISDFGMARVFRGDEDQANTLRVVGTYGYMSPEYAMSGKFSEKSDIFSFGVLLLEIISGRSIHSFDDEECLGLLGYAWKLWNEDNILPLIDATISKPEFEADILRCLQLALLCVQEFPEERPTVSSIISMLHRDIETLPHPKQPGFTQKRNFAISEFYQSGQQYHSVNHISLTSMGAR